MLTLTHSTYSQNRKYFIITGKIISEIATTDKSTIQIIKKDKRPMSSEIPSNGRFRLELDYNSEYQLVFSQNGYLPKTIVVNTEVPEEALLQSANFSNFLIEVKLLKENQEFSTHYSDEQNQQIAYSTLQNDFSRMPIIQDVQLMNSKSNQNSITTHQTPESKSKLQGYQTF
ncbi:MAG: hypothetical protein JNK09_17065 [Prolixibacteraceae bacterium]|nr:hypothetical protein [Prolixibacteraceae bacterium]